MNKSNILAAGVLLIALGLYLQSTQGMIRETIVNNIGENTFISLATLLFWIGLIVVIISILIKPKRRKILIPAEAVEEAPYGAQEEAETGEVETEQAYEETTPEEIVEEPLREEEEEEPKKISEVIGFCPRCGAPVTEGIRYCRKCGLKLK
ncbi:MAG: zinc ribbon domain-containing protein [Candidatus Brockarchaeota archaeon]|nr:zinc ribbon domain-containing protein [Candidatus Brockarchaeota archaeon]